MEKWHMLQFPSLAPLPSWGRVNPSLCLPQAHFPCCWVTDLQQPLIFPLGILTCWGERLCWGAVTPSITKGISTT